MFYKRKNSWAEEASINFPWKSFVGGLCVVRFNSCLDTVDVLLLSLAWDDEWVVEWHGLDWLHFNAVLQHTSMIISNSLFLIENLILVLEKLLMLIVLGLQYKVKVICWSLRVVVVDLMAGGAQRVVGTESLPRLLALGEVGRHRVADALRISSTHKIVVILILFERVRVSWWLHSHGVEYGLS